jgi:hypothetical protein
VQVQDVVLLVTALGGAAGIGAGFRALATTFRLMRRGVSAREGKRKVDLVQQRDEALHQVRIERSRVAKATESAERSAARADAEQTRAEWAEENRQISIENEQRSREHAADLRVQLVERGVRREDLPVWPHMEDPVSRAELNRRVLEGQRVKHPSVDDEPEYYRTQTRAEVEAQRWRPTD